MNHQPFENWLLSDEPLSQDNADELDTHLEHCENCRELKNSWSDVVDLFQDVPDVEPLPGFAVRWQERLSFEHQIEKIVRHRWQSIIVLILIGNVIAGLVFLLSTQLFSTFETPLSLLLTGVYRLASFVTFFNAIQNIFFTLLRTATSVVPVGLWVVIGVGLVGSCAIWIISLTSLNVLRRRI
jgi:predicted anti-sigma-YlaC factor YlaD